MSLTLYTEPQDWSSLFSNEGIEYVFKFFDVTYTSVVNNGGYAELRLSSTYNYSSNVDEYVYVDGTVYSGMYRIRSVPSNTRVVIDKVYSATDAGGVGLISAVTSLYLVAGYPSGHDYYTELPERTVCYLQGIADTDGIMRIRVEEYLRSVFKIKAPTSGFDYSMSVPYKLMQDIVGQHGNDKYALNSACKHSDVLGYTVAGTILAPNAYVEFGYSPTIISQIVEAAGAVYNTFIDNQSGAADGVSQMYVKHPFIVK